MGECAFCKKVGEDVHIDICDENETPLKICEDCDDKVKWERENELRSDR